MRDLTRGLGVGTCCGKCLPHAKAALSTSLQLHAEAHSATPYFPGTVPEFAV